MIITKAFRYLLLLRLGTMISFNRKTLFRRAYVLRSSTHTESTVVPITMSSSAICAPKVILEKGKARLFQDGNPLVYGGAIKELQGNPVSGDIVQVVDHMGNAIGKGVFNSNSTYRVRMFSRSFEKENNYEFPELLQARINQALVMRKSAGLPSATTNAFRAINGEGDRLGGLIVDIFAQTAVIQSNAMWVEHYQREVRTAVKSMLGSEYQILWQRAESRLKQDGFYVDPTSVQKPEVENKHQFVGKELVILENNILYSVNPYDGQKTGFYCDQRDNRRMIRELSDGKSVLDTYCYSGGFGLSAALGGATSVTCIDSSQTALDTAAKNAVLNQVNHKISFHKADAVDYMKNISATGQLFDIVICDPPKLAPNRASLERAKSKYVKINVAALHLVRAGGLMLSCSCSAAVTQSKCLPDIISEAARIAHRDVTVLRTTSAGIDHAVHLNYPEGAYLTAMLLCVN